MLLRAWQFVTLVLVALVLGLAFAHVLERPAKMLYDAALYITLQKTLYVQWGPPNVGGFLEPAAIAATIVLAIALRLRRRRYGYALGASALLLLAFPVVFSLLVAPSNEAFMASAPPGAIPTEWTALRDRWELGHAIRFGLQLAAFSLLVLFIVSDAAPPPQARRDGYPL